MSRRLTEQRCRQQSWRWHGSSKSLEADLAAVAAVGDEQTRAVAERVLQAIRGSAGLRLLDALGEAALEISAQLPEGIEVRLVGQDGARIRRRGGSSS